MNLQYYKDNLHVLDTRGSSPFTCDNCNQTTIIHNGSLRKRVKINSKYGFCSKQCFQKFHYKGTHVTLTCSFCKKEFDRTRGKANKTKHPCCSVSCASNLKVLQDARNRNPSFLEDSQLILRDAKQMVRWKAKVSTAARTIYRKHNQALECKACGYSLHVDVCHIRPISTFPDSATISEVSNLSNLVGLCKNCHWELDHIYHDLEVLLHIHAELK